MIPLDRRTFLAGSVGAGGLVAVAGVTGCSTTQSANSLAQAIRRTEVERRPRNQRRVTARLTPRPITVNLGGSVVQTWGYGDSVPGPLLRARAGDLLSVTVDNRLTAATSVHWHGVALRNDMDGVPEVTQEAIQPGTSFRYEFTVPDPGTYFYHSHFGVQLDRGLSGPLVIDDPAEPGKYDKEWILLLDDWVDGTGRTPDDILQQMQGGRSSGQGGMSMSLGSMDGMDMGGTDVGTGDGSMQSRLLGGAGDVNYPNYLINGRTPKAPVTLTGKPGQRVRIRIINAGADTAFRLALGGHRMTVTHSDGFPVQQVQTDALLIGMGERYDVIATLLDGSFPLIAAAEGKRGQAVAVVRTASGAAPSGDAKPAELQRRVIVGTDLTATDDVRLPSRRVDRRHDLSLNGKMMPYRWTINGAAFPDAAPLLVTQGERVRLRFRNRSKMFHPMHLHGHTFGLVNGGARKDTVIVGPTRTVDVDVDAANPGRWATHCHNIYHAEAGMMTTLSYEA